MRDTALNVLVLSTFDGTNANVIRDFLFSFKTHSRHRYYYVFDCTILDERTDFSSFDIILVFWSVYLLGPDITRAVRDRIRRASALKVLFLQDEYRDVRPMNRVMSELGIQVMFTCVAPGDHETFYPRREIPSLEGVYTVLPGYVPGYLEQRVGPPLASRSLDIGYRSRDVPCYLGDLAREKRIVADRFEAIARERGFRADISVREQDRLYGQRWLDFLAASRCVLGTASGASVVDFTGEIRKQCERYLGLHPDATYDEVKRRFFADVDGRVVIDTVSPRIFEAAAFGCTLVHHEGGYAGILEPGRHYIQVRRDYSNIDDVVDRIRDQKYCAAMADNARRDLVASGRYAYRAFAAEFDARLAIHAPRRARSARVSPGWFYAKNFVRHEQAIVPYRDRFLVLPSRKLANDLARRALSKLPVCHFGPLVSRFIENPGNFFVKLHLSTQVALRVTPLRRLVTTYARDAVLRKQVRYHELMNDVVKLDIVRRARAGTLRAREPFRIGLGFDPTSGALTLTSNAGGNGTGRRGLAAHELSDMFARRRVKILVWDHSALSLQVVYAPVGSKWITVGLGTGGIYRFDAVLKLADRHPERCAEILTSMLLGDQRPRGRAR